MRGAKMMEPYRRAAFLPAVMLIASLGGCGSEPSSSLFVGTGDPFFDDAASRLSPADKKRFGVERADQLEGFFFQGQSESCVVLLPRKRNIVLHGPDVAFCYDARNNEFKRRV